MVDDVEKAVPATGFSDGGRYRILIAPTSEQRGDGNNRKVGRMPRTDCR
jgi:hypothetical protein